MKNICIFNGDMSRGGGTERITQILANSLSAEEGYKVYVLSYNNESGKSYYPLNPEVISVALKPNGIIKKIIELRRFLTKNKIDIIIDVDIMLGIYALPATFLKKTKLISWEMFNIRNDIGSKHTAFFRKLCLIRSAYYVNQTKGDMEAFKAEMPVKCPITYIYNPCEIDYSYTDYDENSKIIVTLGHFYRTKGYDLAVEVAKYVFEKHPDWKWEFYGDGKEFEAVKQTINEYNLENNVILCGRTSDTESVYKKASMYVMTSRTEGFGLVLTEAKSYNLPTLSFDIDFGPREIIEDGVSGYLVEAFDIQKMADCICELIDDKEKRIQFSNNAKNNCGKFSQQEFINKWMQIINII